MVNNVLKVRDGVNMLLNRGYKFSPTIGEPSRFKVTINTPDITWTDTSTSIEVPISGTETSDDCSVVTGWTASGTNSVTANAVTFKPDGGTDGALNIVKSDVSSATVSVSKTVTSLDGTSKDLTFWVFVLDAAALAKVLSSAVRFGSGVADYYLFGLTLVVGWNFVKISIPSGFDSTVGAPVIGTLDYFYLDVVTNNAADTLVAGDIIFDSIRLASVDDYYKSVDATITFDTTDGSVAVLSKLSVSEANGFLLDGHSVVNSDSPEVVSDKAKFPSDSKGTTDLFKFTNKVKIRNANQV